LGCSVVGDNTNNGGEVKNTLRLSIDDVQSIDEAVELLSLLGYEVYTAEMLNSVNLLGVF